MYQRLVRFKQEKNPVFVPYFPQNDDKNKIVYASVSNALSTFENLRKKQIDLIKTFDGAVFKNEGIHPEYKRYNTMIVARHILMHDFWHMYRIEELWLTTDEYLTEQ